MTSTAVHGGKETSRPLLAGRNWIARTRLFCGLMLFTYLTTHLLNHSLGLISYQTMEAGRLWAEALWRNPLGSTLLLSSLVVHVGLAIYSLLRRRTYKGMAIGEIVQVSLGLAIPPLLAIHIIGTRLLHEFHGVDDSYALVLVSIWIVEPLYSVQQSTVLIVAWLHGCIGVHYWLRLKPWYRRVVSYLYAGALLLPVMALAGFLNGAREVEALFTDPLWRETFFRESGVSDAAVAWGYQVLDYTNGTMIALVVLLGGGRALMELHRRRQGTFRVTYPDRRSMRVPLGHSILEVSRLAGVPHASVCGGRGRCSTCRVRILEGWDRLPEPSDEEIRVLKRVGMPERVRLACQCQPTDDVSVVPLLPARATPRDAYGRPGYLHGTEREMVILFADLRSFTRFAERALPYDVVFIINQYFRHMGEAIEKAGGRVDKFIGDGVMALFGLDDAPETACRKALDAAAGMAAALDEMNASLKSDLTEPFRIGIGLHVGNVIVGEMGYGRTVSVTAIGDAVNTASRLEALNKDFESQLIFSHRVAELAGLPTGGLRSESVMIRGRQSAIDVLVIENAARLATVASA